MAYASRILLNHSKKVTSFSIPFSPIIFRSYATFAIDENSNWVWLLVFLLLLRFDWILGSYEIEELYDQPGIICDLWSQLAPWFELNQINWKALWFCFCEMIEICNAIWSFVLFFLCARCDSWRMFPLYCGASRLHQSVTSPVLSVHLWAEKVMLSSWSRSFLCGVSP